ncbi:MAG: hypothetical protein V5A62_08370 [Haloarculaceae archaeon]
MFGLPVESWYLWVGLAAASAALIGIAVELPRTTPPDAAAVAATVDGVAASPYDAVGEHPIRADAVRLSARGAALRRDGATDRAEFSFGPVVPVPPGDGPLRRVLDGNSTAERFDSPAAFAAATERARERDPTWRPAPDRLTVRRVSWRGVDATLVG